MSRSFHSKILLFGEYSVIKHSMALSTPYPLFEGKLAFRREGNIGIDNELKSFSRFMNDLSNKEMFEFEFDVSSFEFDVGQGLYFDSSIPLGYGVGSSGALTAAIYERYGTSLKENKHSITELKTIFSIMESHFHGASSGLDPLISYLDESILIREDNQLNTVQIPEFNKGEGAIFLLNTGRSRKTEPLVNLFLEKSKIKEFNKSCEHILLPVTNNCITNFLEGKFVELYENFRDLSEFQFEEFNPMIPKLYRDIWSQGLGSESFYLKLCGAGGGGFLLGMAEDFKLACEQLEQYEIRPLYRF